MPDLGGKRETQRPDRRENSHFVFQEAKVHINHKHGTAEEHNGRDKQNSDPGMHFIHFSGIYPPHRI
jgi:hypothetical protein